MRMIIKGNKRSQSNNKTLYNSLAPRSDVENSSLYRSLAPRSDIENATEYLSALSWAINQKDIHNIAVSGPYGSGKSSVINAFLKNNTKKKVLRISLAAFKSLDEPNESNADIQTKRLEEEILKQIFYSVSTKKIPRSRFRRITKVKWISTIIPSLIMVLVILAMVCFFQYERLFELLDKINESLGAWSIAIYIFSLFLLMSVFSVLVKWIKENGRIREVNVLDKTGITLAEFDSDSVFNRNMDEIVYFFENTNTEIVVIEDLDRHKYSAIFTDLRNLNTILNNNEKIAGRIKFIYAIKDDLFTDSKERTKFFDFIIPVVPVVSSSNSVEVLRELLKFDNGAYRSTIYDISGEFIVMISPYISDMRDIICICNEFIVFKNTLKGNQELDLDDEKMFALMVFKNLYPKEFSDFEEEKETDLVRTAFSNKHKLINEKNNYLNEKKAIVAKELDEIKNDSLKTVKELKSAMLFSLLDQPEAIIKISFNGSSYTIKDILNDSFDVNSLKKKRLTIQTVNNIHTIVDVESVISPRGNYFERIAHVQNGVDSCIEQAQQKIAEFESKMGDMNSWSMVQTIKFVGIDFLGKSIIDNPLLVFLLRHGFIDESYENYINYFRPNSISKEEMNFILGIRNHFSYYYSFPITNVAQVFERLIDFEFELPQVLNYCLVDYVLMYRSESSAVVYLMKQLSNQSDSSLKFIKAYIDRGYCLEVFLRLLVKQNQHFWYDLINDGTIQKDKGFEYLSLVLNYCDTQDILQQDLYDAESEPLSTFILYYEDSLLKFKNVNVEKQISVFEGLNIVFYRTDLKIVDEKIKEYIFSNNKYEMNVFMLRQLFEWRKPELLEEFSRQNFTSIKALNYEPLSKRIASEFPKYVSNVFLKIETNTEETFEAINEIIEALLPTDEDLCIQVLDRNKVIWKDINNCCSNEQKEYGDAKQTIWKYLISNDRVLAVIENVQSYFDLFALDDELVAFFERHESALLEHINDPIVTEEFKNSLFYSGISNQVFRHFIIVAVFNFTITDFAELGREKTEILIAEGRLKLTAQYWIMIHALWPELSYVFARKKVDDFFVALSQIDIDQDTLVALLNSDEFNDTEKNAILSHFKVELMTEEGAVFLCNIEYSIPKRYSDYAWKLLNNNHKIQLLINQAENYSLNELSNLIGEIGKDYSTLVAGKRHRYSVPFTDLNDRLTEKLYSIGYVTSRKICPINDKQSIQEITGFVKELSQ